MKKKHYLVTGSSRGIGEAIVKCLLKEEHRVFCISRNQNPRLQVEAYTKGMRIRDIAFDLTDTGRIKEVMREIFRGIQADQVEAFYLINNAGTIHPIREVGEDMGSDKVIRNLSVNLVAPMVITDLFIQMTEEFGIPRRIVNISTGAARRPVHGWSAYCSSKAGLEMFTQCLVQEQADKENPVKVVAFAPGVVDTEMQAEIRESSEESFPERAKFRDMKESGDLIAPSRVAEVILDLLDREDFGQETFLDIRKLPWEG